MTGLPTWERGGGYINPCVVAHHGRAWIVAWASCGEEPGTGDRWRLATQDEIAAWQACEAKRQSTPKATMAESLDERIGRGA